MKGSLWMLPPVTIWPYLAYTPSLTGWQRRWRLFEDNAGTSSMAKWNSKGLAISGLAAVFLAAATVPHIAAAQAPDPNLKWVKVCNTDPNTDKELCLVIQELRAETGQFIASAAVRQFTGESDISFVAAVPPGMLLQPGLRVQIDGGTQHELPFEICFPNACYGELKVDQEFVDAMKAGGQLTISTLNQGEKIVTFPLTLIGFTKIYDGKGLDPAGAQARQSELNRALQARAAEARKRLIERQQSTGSN